LNQQKSAIAEEKTTLEARVAELEAAAAATVPVAAATGVVPDPALVEQIKTLEATIVRPFLDQLHPVSDNAAQATLRMEKAKVEEEKEALSKTIVTPSNSAGGSTDAPPTWEAERLELIKARDEALEKVKVCSISVEG